jgi:hypothetical protein
VKAASSPDVEVRRIALAVIVRLSKAISSRFPESVRICTNVADGMRWNSVAASVWLRWRMRGASD